jgi:CDP-diacylglycerol--glycerol-3-phosphate 3-phosphatidyltransferase
MNKKKTRLTFSYIAINGITLYRLVSTVFLVYLIVNQQVGLFKWLLAVSFFTDAIDGFLARRFKVVSELGSRMDSVADDLTILVAMVGLYFFKYDFLTQHYVYFILLLILFVVQSTSAIIRYRKLTSFHTMVAKLAAILQGCFLILIFFLPQPLMILFYSAVAVTAIQLLEEIILIIILPRWQMDVKGIYWVLKKKDK